MRVLSVRVRARTIRETKIDARHYDTITIRLMMSAPAEYTLLRYERVVADDALCVARAFITRSPCACVLRMFYRAVCCLMRHDDDAISLTLFFVTPCATLPARHAPCATMLLDYFAMPRDVIVRHIASVAACLLQLTPCCYALLFIYDGAFS